jgi:deazaflavin-dependent oxidoreductase (nitroreductase family)
MSSFPRPNRFMGFLYSIGLGPLVGRVVLLLTTTGRRTGLLRVTPLQYEEVDGAFYVGSMLGTRADWFRNLVADSNVEVRIKSKRIKAKAETITDPGRIADFLELRLERHPRMLGVILRSEGLPQRPNRAQLELYAEKIAIVKIIPME